MDIGEAIIGFLEALLRIARALILLLYWLRIPLIFAGVCGLGYYINFEFSGQVSSFPVNTMLWLQGGAIVGLLFLALWFGVLYQRRHRPMEGRAESSFWLRTSTNEPGWLKALGFILSIAVFYGAVFYASGVHYVHIDKSWTRVNPEVPSIERTFLDFDREPKLWQLVTKHKGLQSHVKRYHKAAYLRQFPPVPRPRTIVGKAKGWYKKAKNMGKKAVGVSKSLWKFGRSVLKNPQKRK